MRSRSLRVVLCVCLLSSSAGPSWAAAVPAGASRASALQSAPLPRLPSSRAAPAGASLLPAPVSPPSALQSYLPVASVMASEARAYAGAAAAPDLAPASAQAPRPEDDPKLGEPASARGILELGARLLAETPSVPAHESLGVLGGVFDRSSKHGGDAAAAAGDVRASAGVRATVRELMRLRREVNEEARAISHAEIGGQIGDGALHRDVVRIVRRLLSANGLDPDSAQLFIGNSFIPNAFLLRSQKEGQHARRGGVPARIANVFISLGLLRAVQSEAELAWALAHELSHHLKGHLTGEAHVALASNLLLGHFHEFEADSEGLVLMARAGYDPRQALDALRSLNLEYERLEKDYSLLKRSRDDVTETLRRIRDVHPHEDLRRAKMLERMDEAQEAYRPWQGHTPTSPVWMARRDAAAHPARLERFEARLRSRLDGKSIPDALHGLENFTQYEQAKPRGKYSGGAMSREEYAVIERGYRDLAERSRSAKELRAVEVSVQRQPSRVHILTNRLRAALIHRQLHFVLEDGPQRAGMQELLRRSATLSPASRRAGTLRVLGRIANRGELDEAYDVLALEAENLNLDPYGGGKDAGGAASDGAAGLKRAVAERLWSAARRVLTLERGRPAKPEEIIAELLARLPPLWIKDYLWSLKLEAFETAFGPAAGRSETYRPSQLMLLLDGRDPEKYSAGHDAVNGILAEWERRHHALLSARWENGRAVPQYERFYLKGLAAPSLDDQLDVMKRFGGWSLSLPPSFLRLVRKEDGVEKLLRASLRRFAADLREKLESSADRTGAADAYHKQVSGLLDSLLASGSGLEESNRLVRCAWEEVRPLLTEENLRSKLLGAGNGFSARSSRPALLDSFIRPLNTAARGEAVRLDSAGSRPAHAALRATADIVREIESALLSRPDGDGEASVAYARNLKAHSGSALEYTLAFEQAAPWAFEHRVSWRDRFAAGRARRRVALSGSSGAPLPPLDGEVDYVHLLAWIGDPSKAPETKAAAAALADHLSRDSSQIRLRSDAVLARWLLEDAVASAQTPDSVRVLAGFLARLGELHPDMTFPGQVRSGKHDEDRRDFASVEIRSKSTGKIGRGFQEGALHVRRSEPLRGFMNREHPFRGVNTRWSLDLLAKLDRDQAWPEGFSERFALLDFMNATGEYSDVIDQRLVDMAKADLPGFARWLAEDRLRVQSWGGDDDGRERDLGWIETPFGTLAVPEATSLRIVRNPTLRAQLFELTAESRIEERARPSWRRRLAQYGSLLRAWLEARRYFSGEFLKRMRQEGSLKEKYVEALRESDRYATWRGSITDERKIQDRRAKAMEALYRLYQVHIAIREPVLDFLLKNYPEPTRARDELVERLMRSRRLSPGTLAFLESHKSYRMPNPLRVVEKQLMDTAIIQMRKFSPREKADILLHIAGIERLTPEKERRFNRRVLSGDRRAVARDYGSIRTLAQLQDYLSLIHPKDKTLLVRALFYGENSLNSDPAQVERLHEKLVIEGRDLPPFLVHVFRANFRVLNEDERAQMISELAAAERLDQGLKGPEILRVALKGRGILGAKIAQVLATHKGLLPDAYAPVLEGFKDRAQDLTKMSMAELLAVRLDALDLEAGADEPGVSLETILEQTSETQSGKTDGEALRRRLARQVRYLLKSRGRKATRVQAMGLELGSGSIKTVYKIELNDGKIWVAKLRIPGAAYRLKREFELLSALIADLEAAGRLDAAQSVHARQLLEEVRVLINAELDFTGEAAKEVATRETLRARPLYARLLAGPSPMLSRPHPVFAGEDLLVEEFVPSRRFADLPERAFLGADKRALSRMVIDEGMFSMVFDGWLEPDPHTGNRQAYRAGIFRWLARMLLLDLGQGEPMPLSRLEPLARAAMALEAGEARAAAAELAPMLQPSGRHSSEEVAAAVAAALAKPGPGVFERLMNGVTAAEKAGSIPKPEYASLEKAFILYAGYSRWLPPNYIARSLERAFAARAWRDRTLPRRSLLALGARRLLLGPAAVRDDMRRLLDRMFAASSPPETSPKP